MASHSGSCTLSFGAAKLCQDIAALFDNAQGSDVQFKVGGNILVRENNAAIYDESASVPFYAHSLILRCRSSYFVNILDKNKDWNEKSKCVIYKPNVSPNTFRDVLRYIYTGDIQAENSENIIELITVANDMGLEELSTECRSQFIRIAKYIFSDENEELTKQLIPIGVAIRTHIIPVLNLPSIHSLSYLSQELLTIMLPRMSVIIEPPRVYTSFVKGVSSEALIKIIASNDLALIEPDVWDLALSWGCNHMKLSKIAVEAHLNNLGDDDGTIISDTQLNQLKETIEPILPSIRFSLLDIEDYKHMVNILNFFLPRRRYLEINQFFLNPDGTRLLDIPRKAAKLSKIVAESKTWKLLKRNIFETGGISGCHSPNGLKFKLLFRASYNGFLSSTFHQLCDYKGPTLVIIRSLSGHLFGGVNFNHWKSDNTYSSSALNFLFTLPDECHRKDSETFRLIDGHAQSSSNNVSNWGPVFGKGSDLAIADSANVKEDSYSAMPRSYGKGKEVTNHSLAGSFRFMVSNYEVFAIYKR